MTALGVIWPDTKFRFDTPGVVPHGNTATHPPSLPTVVFAAVTFNDTAPIDPADPGRSPLPSTLNSRTAPASLVPLPTLPTATPPVPLRVSIMRDGVTGINDPPFEFEPEPELLVVDTE